MRIYLLSLAQIVSIVLALVLLETVAIDPPWRRSGPLWAQFLVETLEPDLGDAAASRATLQRIERDLDARLTVRGADDALLAGPDPPAPALTSAERDRLPRSGATMLPRPGGPAVAVWLRTRPGGYAVVDLPRPRLPVAGLVRGLVVALAMMALWSALFARSLARPLQRVAGVARALGAGDLGARVRLLRDDELGDVAAAVDEMAERITRLLDEDKRLLASVSHELRTPLACIGVALDLAEEGRAQWTPEVVAEALGEVRTHVAELGQLVDSLLVTARLDAQAIAGGPLAAPLTPVRVDVAALLSRAAARFASLHPGHLLEVDVDPALPALLADPGLLLRAVDNLLANAARYSQAGSRVALSARPGVGQDGGERVVIAVRDQGVGIAEADLPRLFTPFFRADPSRTRATGGVGLGLSLVKRIASAHGGEVDVESRAGAGSTFRIVLPTHGS